MTAETKVTNYTDEQTDILKIAYTANPTQATVEALAAQLGKTAKSVIAKLAKEGVYKSKSKETSGKREMLKREMVTEMAVLLGKDEEQLESLEKATGPALMAVLCALRAVKI